MDHKEIGDTGVQIPEIGLGTFRETVAPPLRRGIELGSVLIDTAEFYGSERVVGVTIREMRDRVFIATKVSPTHFRHEDVIKAADRSLRSLGLNYIDLYQLHWPNPNVPIGETMGAMEELVTQGKVRFIGVSNFSVAQMQEAQAAMSTYRIASNQVPYNILDRGVEAEVLPYCQNNKITLIAYSPLAANIKSLLAGDKQGVLNQVAVKIGRTEAQVALNWCISKDNVIAIPRSNSVAHTEENCQASGWRLSAEDVSALEEAFPR